MHHRPYHIVLHDGTMDFDVSWASADRLESNRINFIQCIRWLAHSWHSKSLPAKIINHLHSLDMTLLIAFHQQSPKTSVLFLVNPPSWLAAKSCTKKRKAYYGSDQLKLCLQNAVQDILERINAHPIMWDCCMFAGRPKKLQTENKSFIFSHAKLAGKSKSIFVSGSLSRNEGLAIPSQSIFSVLILRGTVRIMPWWSIKQAETFKKRIHLTLDRLCCTLQISLHFTIYRQSYWAIISFFYRVPGKVLHSFLQGNWRWCKGPLFQYIFKFWEWQSVFTTGETRHGSTAVLETNMGLLARV